MTRAYDSVCMHDEDVVSKKLARFYSLTLGRSRTFPPHPMAAAHGAEPYGFRGFPRITLYGAHCRALNSDVISGVQMHQTNLHFSIYRPRPIARAPIAPIASPNALERADSPASTSCSCYVSSPSRLAASSMSSSSGRNARSAQRCMTRADRR